MNRSIEIVCHRGANQYAPENTYASAQYCLDWGMDYLEIDVNISKDGILHVFHGPELAKTTTGSGYIFQHTAAELAKFDAGSWFDPRFAEERIPQLKPFLRWLNGRIKLFFDVKLADLHQLISLVKWFNLEDSCFFWFEFDSVARELKRLAPNLTLKMNAVTIEGIIEANEVYQAQIIEMGLDSLTDEFIRACRQRGMKVMVNYGGDDPAVIREIGRYQPDMINTDHGDLCAKLLR